MRRERVTYEGAYHHVMNRGYDGNHIFEGNKTKSQFLDYLEVAAQKNKIRLFAYCVMNNHYHLILENSNGRMSDFLKLLNGQYGMFYRKKFGGKGYVFQNRYKSTIIENDAYLIKSINYCLQNPVRAGIVSHAEHYIWSSAGHYFKLPEQDCSFLDIEFVNQLFGSKEALLSNLGTIDDRMLPVQKTKHGEVLGSEVFLEHALQKHNRRKIHHEESLGVQRFDDKFFYPVEQVLWQFKKSCEVDPDKINAKTWVGKRLRGELLVLLRDRAGLKYKEIREIGVFSDLSFSSLRDLYRRTKQMQEKKSGEKK